MYERYVKKMDNRHGFIDLFWPRVLLVEQKSAGRDLAKALEQADEYFLALGVDKRPRYVLACDFQNFHLIDLETRGEWEFGLAALPDRTELFDFIRGIKRRDFANEDPVSIAAAEIMGRLHDALKESGYHPHDMEHLLTRLIFCLFADDTGIFAHGMLRTYIENQTGSSNLGPKLIELFDVLNTPEDGRQREFAPEVAEFPYINGELFKERIRVPAFNPKMRDRLIEASKFDWSKVSPAIFGSLFQSVMDRQERRAIGAHYTTEENIMKVIRPLFLDRLTEEFESIRRGKGGRRESKLRGFQDRLASLTFFDPACGSGNFLIVAYRELRRLELRVILELHDMKTKLLDVSKLSKIDVDRFYGIEIKEFSARIAEVSLWMMDHMMNTELSSKCGFPYARIPLSKSPNIRNADALEIDWDGVLDSARCSYVLGNPPYGGSKIMGREQREQIQNIARIGRGGGTLDYVTGWFLKAARYIRGNTVIGFVATNSISQGEQVGQLWPVLAREVEIVFAHESFKWGSEARGKAHVHVIILGLAKKAKNGGPVRRLFHYEEEGVFESNPRYISPYVCGTAKPGVVVHESPRPLNGLPGMVMGSKPIDGGNFIFKKEERTEFLRREPKAKKFMKEYVSARDFIHGGKRWILALHCIEPAELGRMPETRKRVEMVKKFRLNSRAGGTRHLAHTPTVYHLNVIPKKRFLVIPGVSSEKREYVPIGFLKRCTIPSNACLVIESASLGLFGLLTSRMHMVWLNAIGGRLESRFRYSAGVVYNTFPVPALRPKPATRAERGKAILKRLKGLEGHAQGILDARANHGGSTLADLYDPVTMPADLRKAHLELDKKVEKMYRKKPFASDRERLEFLLNEYQKMTEKNQSTLD